MKRFTRALGDYFGSCSLLSAKVAGTGAPAKRVGVPSAYRRRRRGSRLGFFSQFNSLALASRSALFQPLEERVMLDIGGANSLPPTIVVGRTVSAYDVPALQNSSGQNNQETLTFTVYNQAADPISGVLLTDTLESGVIFAGASQLPDQNGQQLAWSLDTIQPYDRASVTLTVTLGAGLLTPPPTSPVQLDTGASAYGTLDAGMVTWTTAPATLRTTAIAADLLASTPDANTTDPYVQEKAAELNYDPTQIYSFLHTQIGYNSYVGSLRGARGTLWSSAGNSLDDASLAVALMRASGIPAQYEQGTLSQSQAQQLILSMFPASYQTAGYIPAGTQTSDPADDPTLLSETAQHYWFQFDSGSGMQDADPEFSGQAMGQTATASTGSFVEVPQNVRQTTEVSLTAEIYNQGAAALTGSNGLSRRVVLDHTFNDVDLVGRPLTIGNFVQTTGSGAVFSTETNTYSPYIQVGDDAYPDLNNDQVIRGQDYQEVIGSFPLASEILTGLFIDVNVNVPGSAPHQFEHIMLDRIGFAARSGGVVIPVTVAPTNPPAISNFDVVTVDVAPGLEDPSSAAHAAEELNHIGNSFGALTSAQQTERSNDVVHLAANAVIEQTRAVAAAILLASQGLSQRLADISLVKTYASQPRIFLVSNKPADTTTSTPAAFSVDLLSDTLRIVVLPGQKASESFGFNVQFGVLESVIETEVPAQMFSAVSSISAPMSTATIFQTAQAEGVPFATITPANAGLLEALTISAEAKARISLALTDGKSIVVPTKSVTVNGVDTIGWLEVDPVTGQTTGVLEDGTHGDAALFYAVLGTLTALLILGLVPIFGLDCTIAELSKTQDCVSEAKKVTVNGATATALWAHKTLPGQVAGLIKKTASVLMQVVDRVSIHSLHFETQTDILARVDPSANDGLIGSVAPVQLTAASVSFNVSQDITGAATSGTVSAPSVAISGALHAAWQSDANSVFGISSLAAANSTIHDSNGSVLGSGTVALTASAPIFATADGNATYGLTGQGSLSFYGSPQTRLGVSGNWNRYSAMVTGNISMVLTVPENNLVFNGQPLSAGTYTITTDAATLSGSGMMSSPDFAGSASITAAGGTLQLGPGSGNLSIGGTSLNTANETTLTGYDGTINVSANGNGTDAVTLSGNSANLMTVAPSPAMLTTKQNTPVSSNTGVNTSFADTYNLTANAPTGWIVTIDDTGNVTVTPAPGTQSGTYPIQVIAQSTTNPDLISQATVEVTVTPTTRGMTFAVNPDPVFTVPFDNAQVPSAFRATIQNSGPSADTYNLTFSTIPAGFTLLDSGTSVTVPAGQTGILGLYLQPMGATLPPAGTQVSFTVTATSTADASITKTVNVTFVMPGIAAATVTNDPLALSTTPGIATTATITITNVGNVPYDAALATTAVSGLTISGLSSPGMIPVGQSLTETATLTPDAGTPLNSTLNATVNVDTAAAVDGVSVVAVRALAGQAGGTPAPQSTVDVTTDVQSEVGAQEQGTAAFAVTNGSGQTVFTSTAVPVTLSTIGELDTFDLGTFSTAGFAAGQYTITVTVDDSSGHAIAGATSSTKLTVNLPVSASVSVDTDNQTPGAVTSTETLNVTSNAVTGNVAIDSTATSVAVNPGAPGLAYVAGTQDISVVDISNPTSPKVLGTFGSKDLNLGGQTAFNLVGMSGNELIVASQPPIVGSAITLLV
jgi:hypothetical protein